MFPCKIASKEISQEIISMIIEFAKYSVHVNVDTQCFIDNAIKITWNNIYNTFMHENFPMALEDVHAYINIKKSKIHRIACRFLVMPCPKAI